MATESSASRRLAAEDKENRAERVQRLMELDTWAPETEHGMLLPGGLITSFALSDAKASYLNGCYVAAIVTCCTALEVVLAGQLQPIPGEEPADLTPDELLEHARDHNIINANEYTTLAATFDLADWYRRYQGPLLFDQRQLAEPGDRYHIAENDSRSVMQATAEYFHRHFALGASPKDPETLMQFFSLNRSMLPK